RTPSSHGCGGWCRPPSCESTTFTPAAAATASTPAMISIAQIELNSWKTRRIWPASGGLRGCRRRYRCSSRLASTRALVSGATSARPLSTLETVAMETPTSSAMVAIVGVPGLSSGPGEVIERSPLYAKTFGEHSSEFRLVQRERVRLSKPDKYRPKCAGLWQRCCWKVLTCPALEPNLPQHTAVLFSKLSKAAHPSDLPDRCAWGRVRAKGRHE